ncbi:MAG: hypothetical protein JSR44_08550 [Spirochaetes bacterium]|nr:hypothetical protein [Spirochaetota bacterium]
MKKTSLLMTAALAGIALAGGVGAKEAKSKAKKGECHGINGCKGQGDCGSKAHSCAGMNACKGQGWKKMTAAECKAKKGKFQAMTMEM